MPINPDKQEPEETEGQVTDDETTKETQIVDEELILGFSYLAAAVIGGGILILIILVCFVLCCLCKRSKDELEPKNINQQERPAQGNQRAGADLEN